MQRAAKSALKCCRMAIRSVGELEAPAASTLPSHKILLAENTMRWTVVGASIETGPSSMNIHRRDFHHRCTSSPLEATPSNAMRSYATASEAEAVDAHQEKHSCWNCESVVKRNNFFCGDCGRIQALASDSDFFTLFG